jgi:hypothetical protein
VHFREVDWINIAEERCRFRGLFIPDIANAFEKKERQYIGLPVSPIDGAAAKYLGAVPKMRFEFLKGQGHIERPGLLILKA